MGLFSWIKTCYIKSQIALIISSILERHTVLHNFTKSQCQTLARNIVETGWDKLPDVLNGEFSNRPNNIAITLYLIGYGLDRTDGNYQSDIVILLCTVFQEVYDEIKVNEAFYNFQSTDIRLIEMACTYFQLLDRKYYANFPAQHYHTHMSIWVADIMVQVGFDSMFASLASSSLVSRALNSLPKLCYTDPEKQPAFPSALYYIFALHLESYDRTREDYHKYKDAVTLVKQRIYDESFPLDNSPETQLLLSKADKIMSTIEHNKKSIKK